MKKIKIIIFFGMVISFILLSVNNLRGEELQWRVSNSKFNVSPEANTGHLVGCALLSDFFDKQGFKWWQSDLMTLSLGVLWEVKDGYVYYKDVGFLGGEGFSMMDVKLDIAGILLNRTASICIKHYRKKKIERARDKALQWRYY